MKWLGILTFMLLITPEAFSQTFARSWDSWFGQLQLGKATGMQTTGTSYSLGIYKSQANHGFGLDFGGVNLNDSKLIYSTATISQDLLRISGNRRSPFYLYGTLGIGLTHLSNEQLQDKFLITGDDMIHFQGGLSPTYFFSRDFALQMQFRIQKQQLIDFQLDQLWSLQLGMFFLIPNFKPF